MVVAFVVVGDFGWNGERLVDGQFFTNEFADGFAEFFFRHERDASEFDFFDDELNLFGTLWCWFCLY